MTENNLGNTQYFRTKPDQELEVKEVLDLVYNAMDEKGYNPVNQIVGYIMSHGFSVRGKGDQKSDYRSDRKIRAEIPEDL